MCKHIHPVLVYGTLAMMLFGCARESEQIHLRKGETIKLTYHSSDQVSELADPSSPHILLVVTINQVPLSTSSPEVINVMDDQGKILVQGSVAAIAASNLSAACPATIKTEVSKANLSGSLICNVPFAADKISSIEIFNPQTNTRSTATSWGREYLQDLLVLHIGL